MAIHELLLDPTGVNEEQVDSTLSPRPVSLKGLTVGLLDNTKPNATMLLEQIAKELQEHHGAGRVRLYTKEYFGTPLAM
ncbi:MAG TPA: UGSC family (seleno)protein, partial [Marisediminicola sp.]|nr:UGSC family (seleno)protein [Marisediminicola sp.]